MLIPIATVILGLFILIWSADKFISGAEKIAIYLGMPSLLIGMIVVGFGTSAPEMVISAMSSLDGNPSIALGNAYGSNIANIGLILGITIIFKPINVHSKVLKKELPILIFISFLSLFLLLDNLLNFKDAIVLLFVFSGIMWWSIKQNNKKPDDSFGNQIEHQINEKHLSIAHAIVLTILGLVLLIGSAKALVWGCTEIAKQFGISDLIIGLTIVAIGTSLPELASSIVAARKGESDIALGNVIGSNIFNTLAVVGIAGAIKSFTTPQMILYRDLPAVIIFTFLLTLFCIISKKDIQLKRTHGTFLVICYVAYNLILLQTESRLG